ncbi:MAG: glutamate--tRNA ligase [Candidatus Erginobacter occultus]|nr:glutamate--tRNA ligase [Candidatus Erginobacter occultus]
MNKPEPPPRVRFAPSPTGSLHVGGARTALFNWLFARGRGGTYILRIEDTDRLRSREDLSREIIAELGWLGLDWDEGPVFQSRRGELYLPPAERLLEAGLAYRSEPDPEGRTAIILRVEPEEITVFDRVYGKITVAGSELKDIVLIKSDGSPAYNFACAVDDHEMGITHVIRGDDHLPNTPKQILLYRALGWGPPVFAHLPLILGADKTPLSKRHGATSLKAFREAGILPDALVNYLALLGWSPGGDREIMTGEELVREFSLKKVNRKAAVFDHQKLVWMNGRYIQAAAPEELAERLRPLLAGTEWESASPEKLQSVISLLGHRLKTLADFTDLAGFCLEGEIGYDPEAVAKHWAGEDTGEILAETREAIERAEPFTREGLEEALRAVVERRGIKAGALMQPLRVALTGRKDSPGIFEIVALLGREVTLDRLNRALVFLGKNS